MDTQHVVHIMNTYQTYAQAVRAANLSQQPLWDTHCQPDRYVVGWLSCEIEEAPENSEWEQVAIIVSE